MRVGPSRLTSTARSSGESKLTVAAEWMTVSHVARSGPAGLVEAEAVGGDVAADDLHPAVDHGVEAASADSRSRSKASFWKISRWARCSTLRRRPGRISRTSSQPGALRSRRSTSAVPRKPVPPVTAMRWPSSAAAMERSGTATCLPSGK